MRLGKIAAFKIKESMEAWDPATGQFTPDAFLGRIDLTDRFLSNFNKPLRRRMMFTRHGTKMPDSLTIRHPGTRQVYLVGQTRPDATEGKPYLDLTVLQLVTDDPHGSSGLATLYRKQPMGPANDPGWLVETKLGQAFMDLEFRTSANEADTFEIKIENYYAFLPRNIELEPWDYIELHGKRYRVVDTFKDSGFTGLRVDLEPDVRINFYLHVEGSRVYDKSTHEWVATPPVTFNVTGALVKYHDFAAWTSESESYIDVSIESSHIGFRPVPNTMSLEFSGHKRVIKQVTTQPGERQYRLRCM